MVETFFNAISYPFNQKGWIKELLIAIGIAAIPLLGYFMIRGWEYEISYRVRHEAPRWLPGWGNFGNRLWRGILIRAAGFFYNIPTYIVIGITIWLWIGPILEAVSGRIPLNTDIRDIYVPTLGIRVGMIFVSLVVSFLMNSLFWSGYLRYIDTGRYILFFDFGTNLVVMITTMYDDFIQGIYLFLAQLIAGLLTSLVSTMLVATGIGAFLVPIIAPAVDLTFMSMVSAYLFAKMAENTFGEPEDEPQKPSVRLTRRSAPPQQPTRSNYPIRDNELRRHLRRNRGYRIDRSQD